MSRSRRGATLRDAYRGVDAEDATFADCPRGMLSVFQSADAVVLGEQYDLADVLGDVRHRAVHCRDGGQRLTAHVNGRQEIGRAELGERIEQCRPSGVPQIPMIARAARLVCHDELSVTIALRLLAVGREEIGPAGLQISTDVLHDDRDAVRFGIDSAKEILDRRPATSARSASSFCRRNVSRVSSIMVVPSESRLSWVFASMFERAVGVMKAPGLTRYVHGADGLTVSSCC